MNVLEKQLATMLSTKWWALLLRGIAAIIFGVLAWLLPEISLATLVLLFGVYALADGILGSLLAISGRKQHRNWWFLLLWALVSFIVGIVAIMMPGITALTLVLCIAIWAVATGIVQIIVAIRLRKEIKGEWWLILAGFASMVFGILLMLQPGAGAIALLWFLGTYAVIFGFFLVFLALKFYVIHKELRQKNKETSI